MADSPGPESSTQPPRKRARTDAGELERHPLLWYDDGNIVLRAQNTAFRVHRSLLGRHSPVFKDLFAFAQPSADDEIDGVPVVELHDSHFELADFLDVLYNGARFFDSGEKPRYVVVQSLLRLGKKYGVDDLYVRALRRLEQLLPTDIKAWDLAQANSPVTPEPADIISMANITRELELNRLHAMALYMCCLLPAATLVHGTSHSRGTHEKLAPVDLAICIEAQPELLKEKLRTAAALTRCKADRCLDRPRCTQMRLEMQEWSIRSTWLFKTDILATYDTWKGAAGRVTGEMFCSTCDECFKATVQLCRESAIKRLSPIFQRA